MSSAVTAALAELKQGNLAEAEFVLRDQLAKMPTDFDAVVHLADLRRSLGSLDESSDLLRRALMLRPAATHVRAELARREDTKGDPEAALRIIDASPVSDFELLAVKAAVFGNLKRTREEVEVYERLVQERPDFPDLWMSYGTALKTAGARANSEKAFRTAIRLRPMFGEAWWSLANLKNVTFAPHDVTAMKKALRSARDPVDTLHFHFALGKAFEDKQQYSLSFQHYAAGNRIRCDSFPAGSTRITERVDAAISTFTHDVISSNGAAGHPGGPGPIFVVGLQRSGSTLVEQILASHPDIEGTGEPAVLEQIWWDLGQRASDRNPYTAIAQCSPAELYELGEKYLEGMRSYRQTDRPFFVDKLPANWLNVGFIKLILPNAKVIDARRHPLACGFSNFKQNYASGVTFSYSLEAIGIFYRDYLTLMRFFDIVTPGFVHRAINERLIDNLELEVRQMLDFIGLPFSPQCLEFHKTERAVNTPSAEQVRRPINSDGRDAWRPFERWLGPLKSGLGPALDGWED